jgi:FAD-linked sulfhydryl oxidase
MELTYLRRAELGHSAWKVLHTMMAKFPDTPTDEDSAALKSYIFLFARLYPCGDCARHFQQILKQFPPQVSSRKSAASWACYVHNEVNKSLNKPEFDCTKIGDFYDCGCGDDKKGSSAAPTGTEHFTPLTLEKEE